ncbi:MULTISPECIES: hypothetical protein [unclassified Endozoicomonas]|uniref:hypothetical protein n=1 Tax=unclassified Endozoicomonas TaxID=2644528 RepID=UPI002147412E|nr:MULTISPECIES: hypothetical protein [unclassified Endozoicomonas]
MVKLQHYSARLVVPIFLLMALIAEAQTATQSLNITPSPTTISSLTTTSASSKSNSRGLCDSLIGQTAGVERQLKQYRSLFSGRECFVLSADPAEDLADVIKQIPENAVILLSSETVVSSSTATPSASVALATSSVSSAPAPENIPVNYLIGGEITLKDGQDIIGAADEGFEIIISLGSGYYDPHMIRIGMNGNFQFGNVRDSHIRHLTFQPVSPSNTNRTVENIVSGKCYNRRLIVVNNLFHLPLTKAALNLECRESLDASANDIRPGPGLLFVRNTIIGKTATRLRDSYIPEAGVFINLHTIINQTQRVAVIENSFEGDMAKAGDFILGFGSSMDIFRNRVDINNVAKTRRETATGSTVQKDGFSLTGLKDPNVEPPLFNLAGNRIHTKTTAIGVDSRIQLALACNHLQAVNPWRQAIRQFSLKAIDPLPLAGECERSVGSTGVTATPTSPTLCQIVNTWTAIAGSTVDPTTIMGTTVSPTNITSSAVGSTAITGSTDGPLSGLNNLDGQLYFDPSLCPTVSTPFVSNNGTPSYTSTASDNGTVSVSSAGTTEVMTGLGVITTLAVLLAR